MAATGTDTPVTDERASAVCFAMPRVIHEHPQVEPNPCRRSASRSSVTTGRRSPWSTSSAMGVAPFFHATWCSSIYQPLDALLRNALTALQGESICAQELRVLRRRDCEASTIPNAIIHLSFTGKAYDPNAAGTHGINVVLRLIKWAFVALSVFAIVTASDQQQAAIKAGAQAFGGALLTACTREGSPCTTAIGVVNAKVVDAWQASRDQPREQVLPGDARYQLRPDETREELTHSRQW